MNKRKRKLLKAAIAIIDDVSAREERDLKDTPDNIENSEFAQQTFRRNIDDLITAMALIHKVLGRTASGKPA